MAASLDRSQRRKQKSRGKGLAENRISPSEGAVRSAQGRVRRFEVETKRRCDCCNRLLVRHPPPISRRPLVQPTAGESRPDSLGDSVLSATARPIVERSTQSLNFAKCIVLGGKITLSNKIKTNRSAKHISRSIFTENWLLLCRIINWRKVALIHRVTQCFLLGGRGARRSRCCGRIFFHPSHDELSLINWMI